jgi:hypothetical protein
MREDAASPKELPFDELGSVAGRALTGATAPVSVIETAIEPASRMGTVESMECENAALSRPLKGTFAE